MRILYAAYEAAPFFQTGGLGEVAKSLPYALSKVGVKTTLTLPKYSFLYLPNKVYKTGDFFIDFDHKKEKVEIFKMHVANKDISLCLIAHPYLEDPRRGKDRDLKFVFFSMALAKMILIDSEKFGRFDILHLNDLHAAMVAFFLKKSILDTYPPSILTIHNLLYQGAIERQKLIEVTGIDIPGNEHTSLLELGIQEADYITTVSPTYAKEIVNTRIGVNLKKLLYKRRNKLDGILNGIDNELWDPAKDKLITKNYSIGTIEEGKKENKLAFQKDLKLPISETLPLISFIGRIEPRQKGIDLIYNSFKSLLSENSFQFVLLGTGSELWSKKISELVRRYPKRFVFINKFDQVIAHKVYSSSDMVLIPSKYEPCGLVQMIAMRYGTLPLVRKTGGLADTVKDGVNGFVFEQYSATALARTLRLALKMFKENPGKIAKMRETAMKEDFSWVKSAIEYKKLYQKVIKEKKKAS